MAQYRLYIVGANDRLQLAQALDCRHDAEAVAEAAKLLPAGQSAELWDAGRLVGRFSKLGAFAPAN